MFFDPMYLIYVGPALLLAAYAQYKVQSTFSEASRVGTASGLTGAEVALRILRSFGLEGKVGIEG